MTLDPTIGPPRAEDRERSVAVLARAFRDSPLNRVVIRSGSPARRLRANLAGTSMLLPVAEERGRVCVARVGGDVVGVLISTPPYAYPLPPPPLGARVRCLLRQGWGVAIRWAEAFRQLDRIHPVDPHWYLGTLGVEPAHQGCGVGSALLAHWLEDTDTDGVAAYLETDRAENIAFYGRVGFEVEREADVLGAHIWCMRRPAGKG